MLITMIKPDIVETIMAELDLKKTGRNYKALCPFHIEKTPSFIVSTEKQTYHCFGCHEHGDVITFIQKYHDLSFKDALAYLGIISNGNKYRHDSVTIRKRVLKQIYEQWKQAYCLYLVDCLRCLDQAKSLCRTMAEVEIFADAYHKKEIWEYEYQILLSKDEDAKLQLFKEVWNEHKNRQRV
jgi:DNA primase